MNMGKQRLHPSFGGALRCRTQNMGSLWSLAVPCFVSFVFDPWLHLSLLSARSPPLFEHLPDCILCFKASQSSSEESDTLWTSELTLHHLFCLFSLFCHEHLIHPLELPILWQPFMPHYLLDVFSTWSSQSFPNVCFQSYFSFPCLFSCARISCPYTIFRVMLWTLTVLLSFVNNLLLVWIPEEPHGGLLYTQQPSKRPSAQINQVGMRFPWWVLILFCREEERTLDGRSYKMKAFPVHRDILGLFAFFSNSFPQEDAQMQSFLLSVCSVQRGLMCKAVHFLCRTSFYGFCYL